MFEEYECKDWVSEEIRHRIAQALDDDIADEFYDEEWELWKEIDFLKGESNGENETLQQHEQKLEQQDHKGGI